MLAVVAGVNRSPPMLQLPDECGSRLPTTKRKLRETAGVRTSPSRIAVAERTPTVPCIREFRISVAALVMLVLSMTARSPAQGLVPEAYRPQTPRPTNTHPAPRSPVAGSTRQSQPYAQPKPRSETQFTDTRFRPPTGQRQPATTASHRPAAKQQSAAQSDNTAPISPRTPLITPPAEKSGNPSRGTGSVWGTLGALTVVLTLILAGARFWKKHSGVLPGGIPTEALELLGRRAIDQKQVLHLVRLGSRILVLGSSPGGIRTLAEIDDPIEVDLLTGLCQRDESAGSFSQTFGALFNRQANSGSVEAAGSSGSAASQASQPAAAGGRSHAAEDRLMERLRQRAQSETPITGGREHA